MYALGVSKVDTGALRETFFANQLKYRHQLTMSAQSDFLIDGKYTVEVGGKDKGYHQLEGLDNAFIAADDIEYGHESKIPLWMFGFLY